MHYFWTAILVVCTILVIWHWHQQSVEKIGSFLHSDNTGFFIYQIPDFLTPEECDAIARESIPTMVKSQVSDIDTGKSVYKNTRVSQQTFLKPADLVDPLAKRAVHKIEIAAANLTKLPVTNQEDLQVVKYNAGGYFEPHFDAIDEVHVCNDQTKNIANRMYTLLVYLNTLPDDAGGTTSFPHVGISVKPKKGLALLWPNTSAPGKVLEASLHAGAPVYANHTKLIANKWIHYP